MILENVKSPNGIWIKQKIGEMISHKLLWSTASSKKELRRAEEVNAFDRKVLATDWYNATVTWNHYQEERVFDVIETYYDCSSIGFIRDAAIYIDKMLVQAYIKAKDHHDVPPSAIKVKLDSKGELPHGLVYQYQENYENLIPSSITPATKKQLDFLEFLAMKNSYHFNKNGLTKEKASRYISYFKNTDCVSVPEDFDIHFKKAL